MDALVVPWWTAVPVYVLYVVVAACFYKRPGRGNREPAGAYEQRLKEHKEDRRIAARFLLATPIAPVGVMYCVLYGVAWCVIALGKLVVGVWQDAEVPKTKITLPRRREVGSGQLSEPKAGGGEVSEP